MNDNTADVKEPKTWEGWHGPKTNELPSWGIIRYNGDETEDFDGLHAIVDGWYAEKADAQAVFAMWREAHPKSFMALVQSDQIVGPKTSA